MAKATHLECSLCRAEYAADQVQNLCSCGGPLLVRYDLAAIGARWTAADVRNGPNNMWRYGEVLPAAAESIVTLGEGMTPLIRTRRTGERLGAHDLWVKDEGLNPTGSFKARGLVLRGFDGAATRGFEKLAIPSAGNAASALAAYAAAAGIEAHIFMPRDVPQANYIECKAFGAHVTLVDGLISDCAKLVAAGAAAHGWYDISTLKEPYRIEGKKTMGYEVAEQFGWQLPDVDLLSDRRRRRHDRHVEGLRRDGSAGMDRRRAAQDDRGAGGGLPARSARVRAGRRPQPRCGRMPSTVAAGLRVPKPLGDFLVLDAVRASGGTAIAVSDAELLDAGIQLAREEGIFAAPEGAACVAALEKLLASGFLKPNERMVIYNTGAGLKYLEALCHALLRAGARRAG